MSDAYLNTLKAGDRVIETGNNCMRGCSGTVYLNDNNLICVKWDRAVGESRWMGTSVTAGTRKISDVVFDTAVSEGIELSKTQMLLVRACKDQTSTDRLFKIFNKSRMVDDNSRRYIKGVCYALSVIIEGHATLSKGNNYEPVGWWEVVSTAGDYYGASNKFWEKFLMSLKSTIFRSDPKGWKNYRVPAYFRNKEK